MHHKFLQVLSLEIIKFKTFYSLEIVLKFFQKNEISTKKCIQGNQRKTFLSLTLLLDIFVY